MISKTKLIGIVAILLTAILTASMVSAEEPPLNVILENRIYVYEEETEITVTSEFGAFSVGTNGLFPADQIPEGCVATSIPAHTLLCQGTEVSIPVHAANQLNGPAWHINVWQWHAGVRYSVTVTRTVMSELPSMQYLPMILSQ